MSFLRRVMVIFRQQKKHYRTLIYANARMKITLEYEGAREGEGVPLESLKIADCGLLTGTTISFPRSITIAAVEV